MKAILRAKVSCEVASNVTKIAERVSLSSVTGFSLSISYLVPSLKLREMREKEIATFFHTARAKSIHVEKECEFRSCTD